MFGENQTPKSVDFLFKLKWMLPKKTIKVEKKLFFLHFLPTIWRVKGQAKVQLIVTNKYQIMLQENTIKRLNKMTND